MIDSFITKPYPMKLVSSLLNTKLFSSIPHAYPIVVISDSRVGKYVLPPIIEFIESLGYKVITLIFPQGEQNKTWNNFISLQNQLIDNHISSSSPIFGIGGGVVLDIAGFLSSTYCRGMPLFFIPTTLLAMIDASIGGKNGVNFRGLKNRLGTFYPPQEVWICPALLATLPKQEWICGISEAIKHGFIASASLWNFISDHRENLFKSPKILEEFIKRNCQVKADIVTKDPKDQNLRKILNFGHTLAHAIETLSQGYIPHGFAVSVGMIIEMKIALAMGKVNQGDLLQQLSHILTCFHLPTSVKDLRNLIPQHLQKEFHTENIIRILGYDKKNLSTKAIRIITIEHLGHAETHHDSYYITPSMDILYKIIQEEFHVMCYN
ncbi:3-dehydroquinate synthase [Chlamydia avium]|uniref:3-dehydroquinate synthase n=1 Tax=Chlamydia avium TaxID=1457141 RepID=A0ABN0MS16_9CHLA|nr:3-dehydroquinate synthase [Chlamydia avium]EPP36051.1 3-dehydroquinate synthase [Chlamydia psittaci 10_743_SC13]EPP38228.1 3-dehydroquinate synthase [Chlamydia avium]VVT42959.1 3-dehydroquinate synthase [Chlamydia avium]